MTEIPWILDKHNAVVDELKKYVNSDVIGEISEYSNGFVHIGELASPPFILQEFYGNTITCQIRYREYPNRQTNGIYFFDFWRVHSYDDGGMNYVSGWNIDHYSYIYMGNYTLLSEKVRFFLTEYKAKLIDIDVMFPSYPIYDINKLKQEHFCYHHISESEFSLIVNYTELIEEFHQKFHNELLFQIFHKLTAGKDESYYEKMTRAFIY